MNLATAQFLTSEKGKLALEAYGRYSNPELDRALLKQSKKRDNPHIREIVTQIKLQRKAAGKFTRASSILFTSEALEQATEEQLAEYIAQEFQTFLPPNSTVLEIGCGIGGNTIALAKYFRIIALDNNPAHIRLARYNASQYGVKQNIEFVESDADQFLNQLPTEKNNIRAFFFDPQRMRPGRTKTRSLRNTSPPADTTIARMLPVTARGCVKISPAFDSREIESLPSRPALEVISKDNENKLGLLWFGRQSAPARKAVCFFAKAAPFSLECSDTIPKAPVAENPKHYIYEPNKAVIKARLLDEIAYQHGLEKIHPTGAFLTSNTKLAKTHWRAFRIFEVISADATSINQLKQHLRKQNIKHAEITVRNSFLKPEEMRKKLQVREGGSFSILIIGLQGRKIRCIIANKIYPSPHDKDSFL